MKYLLLVMMALPSVLAAPAVEERADTIKVHAVWYHDKVEAKSSLTVLDATKVKTLANACGKSVKLGKIDIGLEVDKNGVGHISVGSKKHLVTYQPDTFKDVVCDSAYSVDEAVVDCTITLPKSAQQYFSNSHATLECYTAKKNRLTIEPEGEVEQVTERDLTYNDFNATSEVEKRQGQNPCSNYQSTFKEGDGNPHQNYRMSQISDNISCSKGVTCTVGYANSKSLTIGWQADISAAGWISGGFAVQTTWTTGNNYECQISGPGTACLWYQTGLTAYTVRNWWVEPCTGNKRDPGAAFVMFSPNKNNKNGKGYICRTGGVCQYWGKGYLVREGRAGGP